MTVPLEVVAWSATSGERAKLMRDMILDESGEKFEHRPLLLSDVGQALG
jgi:hypothetical protein